MKLSEACLFALAGDYVEFSRILDPTMKNSEALVEAMINSKQPKKIVEAFIQITGEPTEHSLVGWLNIADRDKCPRAIEVIGDKLLAKTPTLKRLKLPATVYSRHDPARGANWIAKAMKQIQKATP
jgi:hypothetical protein